MKQTKAHPSFIHRTVLEELRRDIHREEIAFLIGPRQAGKTKVYGFTLIHGLIAD